ncbi:MAG: ribosome silencing factor [Alphaproteobacteria bacterium]
MTGERINGKSLKTGPDSRHRRLLKEKRTIATQLAHLPGPDQVLGLIATSLDDDKAQAVTVIDLDGKSTIADHLVIASGTSSRQVVSMADHLLEKLKQLGVKDAAVEGISQGDWVLIDAGDVIVHLFRPEVRSFYNLEKMWGVAMPEPALAHA